MEGPALTDMKLEFPAAPYNIMTVVAAVGLAQRHMSCRDHNNSYTSYDTITKLQCVDLTGVQVSSLSLLSNVFL